MGVHSFETFTEGVALPLGPQIRGFSSSVDSPGAGAKQSPVVANPGALTARDGFGEPSVVDHDDRRQPLRLGGGVPVTLCSGPVVTSESRWSINHLETRAVCLALRSFLALVWNRSVRILSDNATTVAYINSQGGTRSRLVAAEADQLLAWAERNLQHIAVSHIAGVDNIQADFLSRQQLDPGEWELSEEAMQLLIRRWGVPRLDLMATRANAKAARFFSCRREHGAEGVDALVLSWPSNVLLYVFPPWPLVGKVLRRIEPHQGPVILVAPEWPRRPWFADLINLAIEGPLRLGHIPNHLHQGPVFFDQAELFYLAAWLMRGAS
ncbi:uncharacterized protein LOC115092844 isoform X1 [Rhinatrema bivittatum]|uniref:uncharacterized protein LOC115092844 isoform X1 n=1 Tax=Rhinatrema bivittatum TaxID=194408 RepID=UPI001128A3AC|nr:uncharacterized protein LOC115092844 isoform X1 [Rhinatrema bivittatum]XP_029460046.1 uncharacterized protein LOC115092844 isoform X1 [Rhinatrema bivittatum]XP_029460047.1 uncharacterized protein LOC115092844 isoform X1 [Rhinatrema bivittatum]XP_029460048.1 uncharacterized protein LOC115092844 isoform X1 [Rhinatrema bivittatum]XP_029460049.1 uncharacterized protein LOC115092844 isoform X1 [Rhinatrema bivittatum]XP_029460050.1 uncharacterized protein LOC115092844 isoform X1 [Rhinatrema bivit